MARVVVTLDRERQVRWTNRAQARNASLSRPVSFAHLVKGKNRLYAVCAILWASLVDKDHEFDAPEDLAEFFQTDEQQLAAMKAITALIADAFPEKKSVAKSDSSTIGQAPSSSSGSVSHQSTGGS